MSEGPAEELLELAGRSLTSSDPVPIRLMSLAIALLQVGSELLREVSQSRRGTRRRRWALTGDDPVCFRPGDRFLVVEQGESKEVPTDLADFAAIESTHLLRLLSNSEISKALMLFSSPPQFVALQNLVSALAVVPEPCREQLRVAVTGSSAPTQNGPLTQPRKRASTHRRRRQASRLRRIADALDAEADWSLKAGRDAKPEPS
jgi:hypothetical protein